MKTRGEPGSREAGKQGSRVSTRRPGGGDRVTSRKARAQDDNPGYKITTRVIRRDKGTKEYDHATYTNCCSGLTPPLIHRLYNAFTQVPEALHQAGPAQPQEVVPEPGLPFLPAHIIIKSQVTGQRKAEKVSKGDPRAVGKNSHQQGLYQIEQRKEYQ